MMAEAERVAARILGRLTGSGAPLRRELAELLADRLLARRVSELVDVQALRASVLGVLNVPNLRRLVEQHLGPGFARYAKDAEAQRERVGSLVDPVAHQKLHAAVRKLRVPDARWAEHSLDPALVRRLFGPVWTQVLVNFAKRLPGPLGAAPAAAVSGKVGAPGIAGLLTRSVQAQAEKFIDRSRTVMGGLGAELERRLTASAREWSDSAAHAFRESLVERLHGEEGRELVSQILAGFTDHVLRTRFDQLQPDLDALPVAEILDLVPELVSHASRSEFVQAIVEREIGVWLAEQSERTLGELLDEYRCRDGVRAWLVAQVDTLAADALGAPEFADWLMRVLRDDGTE